MTSLVRFIAEFTAVVVIFTVVFVALIIFVAP